MEVFGLLLKDTFLECLHLFESLGLFRHPLNFIYFLTIGIVENHF